jgi:hypothetical protein
MRAPPVAEPDFLPTGDPIWISHLTRGLRYSHDY